VPRIWEKFHAGITAKLKEATGVKKALVGWAMKVSTKANLLKCEGKEPTGLLALQYKLADKLIYSKLKPAVGLGRAKTCVSGAAPVSKEVLELFLGLDLIVHEVYGQSEDCGPTTFNQPGQTKIGTVGPPVPGVDVRIADDGEIMVKGPNVFKGYYKNPEATAETLTEDGWMHSGDLGSFDGPFLTITGRKKEIIITAGGKNIAPKNIEAALKNHDLINEAVVIGDRRKYLSALVTLDPEATAAWAEKQGISDENLHNNQKVIAEIQAHVDEINKEFAKVETIKRFKILERNLTVEDGELTPTLKVKRRKVYEHFADDIESLYA
jgi:long-chain acyl-CoA synthetase